MSADDLKQLILSLTQDVLFDYQGMSACINPWNIHKFEVGYGDEVKTYTDIDDLMSDKFFNGKSLNEISENLVID